MNNLVFMNEWILTDVSLKSIMFFYNLIDEDKQKPTFIKFFDISQHHYYMVTDI